MSRLASGPEFDFIRSILQRVSTSHPLVRVGAGDDCAIVGDLAISTDVSVDGVHFRRDWISAEEIGWRAAAAALSDLAAVTAEPIGILVSLVVPSADRGDFATSVMNGIINASEVVGATLLGGDTAAGSELAIDVVAIGRSVRPVLRSGAQPGDELWVTGTLGGAAAAVAAWQRGEEPNSVARARYAAPRPRIAEALWLSRELDLHALIDLSDGLYGDAAHLAAASGCAIAIDTGRVPVDTDSGASYGQAVSGGEDYELCFAAAPDAAQQVAERFTDKFGIRLTRIGAVQAGSGVWENGPAGRRTVSQGGYQHFKD